MKCVTRILIGSAAAYNLELGFEPNRVEVDLISTATASIFYRWQGRNQQEHATCVTDSTEYGIKITEGVTAVCDTAAKGISLYGGSKTPRVLIESPVPGKGDIATDVNDWAAASTTPTARSATVIGTIIRPPTHNGRVYECTTATGTYTTEPTAGWSTTIGSVQTDGGSNVWTCREENVTAGKGIGITLGGTLLATTDLFVVRAFVDDDIVDLGTPT